MAKPVIDNIKHDIVISVPPIKIEIQMAWEELTARYQSSVVVVNGILHFTETFWYLAHMRNTSRIVHSVSSHLYSNIHNNQVGDDYLLLKCVALEGFFSLREILAGLVNSVYNLGENNNKIGASNRILHKIKTRNDIIAKDLSSLVPKSSKLGTYLEKYRHPFVHREDLSKITFQDITAALAGKEQPRITEFINDTFEISQWMKQIELSIAKECANKLKIPLTLTNKIKL